MTQPTPIPSPLDSAKQHQNADRDVSPSSLHHTLGTSPTQSSPGSHTHDGSDSKELTTYVRNNAPVAVSGSRGGNVALANLLTALANQGLITNNTTS